MSRRDSSLPDDPVEALRKYTRQGPITYEVADMADLLTDESDRGVVVILGSLLEDILLERLLEALARWAGIWTRRI